MERFEHGGDTWGIGAVVDFSASINPLGMQEGVRRALHASVDGCAAYPDPYCRDLAAAIAGRDGIPVNWVLPCAGATDAFARICLGLRVRKGLVCAPSYAGYEQALELAGAQVLRHGLRPADGFAVDGRLVQAIDAAEGLDAVFVANPNNPTGLTVAPVLMEQLAEATARQGAVLVVDESFIAFTYEAGCLRLLERFPHLVVVRSFTKLHAMAGLRLGYLACADAGRREVLHAAGQPWAVSTPAQAAGIAALSDPGFPARSRAYVAGQREWLAGRLEALNLNVVPGQANYLLFQAPRPLREALLERGVLVRACGSFGRLDNTWHRVAVLTAEENRLLAGALEEVLR